MNRFFYSAPISAFLSTGTDDIWGEISRNSRLDDNNLQKDSWSHEIVALQKSLHGLFGDIYFEYSIPRLGKRADVILLIKNVVIVLEYKVGAKSYDRPDLEQVWDYALDLKYFHDKSHDLWVVPILVATAASERTQVLQPSKYNDQVLEPVCSNDNSLRSIIDQILELLATADSPDGWGNSKYNPTPTIVQAATTLYRRKNLANKSIADITNHTSDDRTDKATDAVLKIVEESKRKGQKSICFITGEPGAGKTLVGLDIAINLFEESTDKKAEAVYLSGNGPLVKVLREALARDAVEQEKNKDPKTKYNKTIAHKAVDSFIMDVYHHRDYVLQMVKKPIPYNSTTLMVDSTIVSNDGSDWLPEHVDIFDEAQRSWTYEQLRNWLSRKKGVQNFPMSEPEFLTWGLDKKRDWAVIQGKLEIVWDGDMIYDPEHLVLNKKDRKKPELTNGPWTQRSFNGGVWQNVASDMRRMYQINAYRVLLTRARQGMVICVPTGNPAKNIDGSYLDLTRLPEFYDSTYNYLKSLGIKDISDEAD